MAGPVAIFIDGAYFAKVLKDEFGSPKVSFEKLAARICGQQEHFRTYYYHCLPHQSNPPTVQEQERYAAARRFYDALNRLPRFEVKFGKLAVRTENGRSIYIQKRVDILLGVDLVLLAAKGRIGRACLITGDSDFIPAVQVAKNEGVIVHLYHGNRGQVHDEIWTQADDRTQFDQAFINSILR